MSIGASASGVVAPVKKLWNKSIIYQLIIALLAGFVLLWVVMKAFLGKTSVGRKIAGSKGIMLALALGIGYAVMYAIVGRK